MSNDFMIWKIECAEKDRMAGEINALRAELDAVKSQRDALVGLCVNFLEVTAPNEPRNDDLLRAWDAMDNFIQDIEGTQS